MKDRDRTLAICILIALAILLFPGCAGSGENGAWTPADGERAVRVVDGSISQWQRIQQMQHPAPINPPGAPFPVYPTSP